MKLNYEVRCKITNFLYAIFRYKESACTYCCDIGDAYVTNGKEMIYFSWK